MSKNISRRWAEYATNLRYEDLTSEAIKAAKLLLTDSIGCALGGSTTEDFHIMCGVLEQLGGKPECTVVGTNRKFDVRSAALANGLAIRAMDYNDVYWRQDPCHPSDLLPAAFSLGEREKVSGKELIVGICIAYELEMRICEAAHPGIRELGWHHATLTAFVAPVVAGRMLRLNVDQITHAIGIGGAHSATFGAVTAGRLTMMKNTVDPMATESGVLAALLAQAGYEGPEEIFEGREGLFEALGEEWDTAPLVNNLGAEFKIVDCSIKPYPSEALTHAPISAVLDLVCEHNLQPDDIERIEIKTLKRAAEILADPAKYVINSRETADHSLPYCIAAAVVYRELTPRQFSHEAISDKRILEMMSRVTAQVEPTFDARFPAEQPCRVEVRLRDNRTLVKERDFPKGDPRDPLSAEEVQAKFMALAENVILIERQRNVFQLVYELESVENVGVLMKELQKG